MNKIELTLEHIAKIFEMCNHFYEGTITEGQAMLDGMVIFKTFHGDDGLHFVKIHWMELCITHLSAKIIFVPKKPLYHCKDTHFRLLDGLIKLFYEEDKNTHPVDFLYEHFKKM